MNEIFDNYMDYEKRVLTTDMYFKDNQSIDDEKKQPIYTKIEQKLNKNKNIKINQKYNINNYFHDRMMKT